ncbi:MAG: acyl-protein synthetase [Oscillospiraceae bacterium]|nr:acyl-protein synthetase [Oscillospiraceae bacterium]
MNAAKKLFRCRDPFDTENTRELFFEAMRDNLTFQYENCPEYRQILQSRGFSPEDMRCYEDTQKIPPLPTLFLKKHHLRSMSEEKCLITATSSGTSGNSSAKSGNFSEISFDTKGLLLGLDMVMTVFGRMGVLSPVPVNYIIMGYRPHKSNRTAVSKTAFGFTLCAPAIRRTYALKMDGGKYLPDLDGVITAIEKYSRSPFPARFIGFPSYMYFALKLMEERGIRVRLPETSMIMLGGGWKQFYKEQPEKHVLYELAEKVLGIPEERIIESFGAAEHPILYCDCKNHHFHVPVYSRVIIRDTCTLKPLKTGEIGIVNLLTPMVRATPILSVMTDDLGVLHEGEECGCGIRSPYLEIIGRVGIKDIKTCAAGAEEFLNSK